MLSSLFDIIHDIILIITIILVTTASIFAYMKSKEAEKEVKDKVTELIKKDIIKNMVSVSQVSDTKSFRTKLDEALKAQRDSHLQRLTETRREDGYLTMDELIRQAKLYGSL